MISNVGLFLILLGGLLFVSETVSESYTRNYDGYVFTSPGLSAYKKRDEAQTSCAQNGSTLLEIKSDNVQALTVQFLSDTGIQFTDPLLLFFTNGMRKDDSWNWVNGQDINSITVYGQGQDLTNSFGYINFNTNPLGLYIAAGVATDMSRGYICQVSGKVDCTNGFSKNGSCYKSNSSPTLSWFDARNRCLNDGGDLASFDFINNDQELNSTLYGSWLSSSTTYWIGIRRQWWQWQNHEARYTNWMSGRPVYRPESSCLCLMKSGTDWKWIECNCNFPFPFVCLTEPQTTPANSASTTQDTSTVSTSTTTTSPGFRNSTTTYLSQPKMESSSSSTDTALGIGLGVGIGGALMIAAIIIAVILVIRKRGCPRCFEETPKSSPPDVTLHPIPDHYAEIPNQNGSGNNPTLDTNQFQSNPPVVYAELEIVTASSPSTENDSISLLSSKTATLPPPNSHKTTNHFTVDGQEYAEVTVAGM